jgi:hypothetical protein
MQMDTDKKKITSFEHTWDFFPGKPDFGAGAADWRETFTRSG